MNLRGLAAAVALVAMLPASGPILAQEPAAAPEWLVVAQGEVVELGAGVIVLAAPEMAVAFTDRPDRLVAMVDLRAFTGTAWGEGGPFAIDPPNASLIGEAGALAVVEITHATYENGRLVLAVRFLEGEAPAVGDHVGVTIDAFPTAVNATGGAAA